MAGSAVVFAPLLPIPDAPDLAWEATIESWLSLVDAAWSDKADALSEATAPAGGFPSSGAPRILPGPRWSKSSSGATQTQNPALRKSAKAWVEQAWARYEAAGRTGAVPESGVAVAHQALGLASRVSTANLCEYRGKYTPLPPKKRPAAASAAFALSTKDPNELEFLGEGATERVIAEEIARAYGGDHLHLWTFGGAAHVWLARSAAPGQMPAISSFSFRLAARARQPQLAALREAFEGSTLSPDFSVLERLLAPAELSVPEWFAAFGVAGMKPEPLVDPAALWADFDRVRTALCRGEAPDGKAAARVNAAIERLGEKLPKKVPTKGPPEAAFAGSERALALAIGALGRQLPEAPKPKDTAEERYRTAVRARTYQALALPPEPERLPRWSALPAVLGPTAAYGGRLDEAEGGILSLELRTEATAQELAELRANLQGTGLIAGYGRAWIDEGRVLGTMCSNLDLALLASVLADLPAASTELKISLGPEHCASFKLYAA